MNKKDKICVVVTGADNVTGMGTARALRRIKCQKIELIGLCTNLNSAFCKSRIWNQIKPVSNEVGELLEQLIAIGRSMSPCKLVLFPVQDDVVRLVSDYRKELGEYFSFVLPSKESVDLLMDKVAFYHWARSKGLPVPESYGVTERSELLDVLNKIEFPVILKPAIRTLKWEETSPKDKVFILKKKEDIDGINFDLFKTSPKFLIQKWVEGSDSDIHFCLMYIDKNWKELGYFTGRKLLQWPTKCGSTAICVGDSNAEVYELTRKVFDAAQFIGMGSLEVKQSSEDKRYYIMELTVGRNDLQSYVAVAGGVNLTCSALFDATDQSQHSSGGTRKKVIWMDEWSTIRALKNSRTSIKHWKTILKYFFRKKAFAYFNLRDPWPFINLFYQKLRRW